MRKKVHISADGRGELHVSRDPQDPMADGLAEVHLRGAHDLDEGGAPDGPFWEVRESGGRDVRLGLPSVGQGDVVGGAEGGDHLPAEDHHLGDQPHGRPGLILDVQVDGRLRIIRIGHLHARFYGGSINRTLKKKIIFFFKSPRPLKSHARIDSRTLALVQLLKIIDKNSCSSDGRFTLE